LPLLLLKANEGELPGHTETDEEFQAGGEVEIAGCIPTVRAIKVPGNGPAAR